MVSKTYKRNEEFQVDIDNMNIVSKDDGDVTSINN